MLKIAIFEWFVQEYLIHFQIPTDVGQGYFVSMSTELSLICRTWFLWRTKSV